MKYILFTTLLLLFLFPLIAPESVWAGESDTYNFSWLDPDKEVYVLQNRRYRKANHVHVYGGVSKNMSAPFVNSASVQGRMGYYFMEEYGFEIIYSKTSGKENDTAKLLRNKGGAGSIPFRRIVQSFYGGMFLWSPFYSKINTFNQIIYYDWIFGAGVGKVKEASNADEFEKGAAGSGFPDTIKEHNAVLWNVGVKIYLGANISTRIDITGVHYKALPPVTGATEELWNDNFELGLMLGYNF